MSASTSTRRDPVALLLRAPSRRPCRSCRRHLPLRRPAAHQHRDVFGHTLSPRRVAANAAEAGESILIPIRARLSSPPRNGEAHATPIRLISHSSSTPDVLAHAPAHLLAERLDVGGRRAAPRLMRKLQCISETCASPTREAAAAGGVDELPGLAAGRVLEGRAAGLLADRLRGLARLGDARPSRRGSRPDRRAGPGTGPAVKITSSGALEWR